MIQTIALFVDAYRDLNSRMLFWITLAISGLLVVVLALVGVEPDCLRIVTFRWEMYDPSFTYRRIILNLFVFGIWLSWAAVVLAIISTGGVFPDLMTGGAIDLYLSKPIGRLRLFLTKYITGLLFVVLQLTIFCTGCFLVVGLRAHEWRSSFFLAIPLVTAMFSYLYAVCVFLGVWMRSILAAILLTVLLWLLFSFVAHVDFFVTSWHRALDLTVAHAEDDIRYVDSQKPSGKLFDFSVGLRRKQRDADLAKIEDAKPFLRVVSVLNPITGVLHRIMPKTKETNDLLDRHMMTDEEIAAARSMEPLPPPAFGANGHEWQEASHEVEDAERHASAAYVVGSSLLSELVVVGLAAWIFCRRDY